MPGVLAGSPIFVSQYLGSNPTTSQASQPAYPVILDEGIIDLHGPKVNNLPIENVAAGFDVGDICKQFQFDYYYRVYVTPAVIALGNLVSSQFRDFDVWNAHFDPKLNSALTIVGDTTGIILTEPEVPPTVFGALESRNYTLNFATTGPATINVTATWDFPEDFPTLLLTGNRVIIWAFTPDWSESVIEGYEWLTQIIEVEAGSEDRYRLRATPRRNMEYAMLINERTKRWAERYLWNWKGRIFAVPLWMDCTLTTSLASLGTSTINLVTTDYTSFKVGGLAIFVDDFNDTEAVEILNVNPTSIDLVRPTLIKDWPAGSKIYPALSGRMDEQSSLTQPTADISMGGVRFEFVDNESIPAIDAPLAYEDGFIMERQPNRADDLEVSWQSKYDVVDFGIAPVVAEDRIGLPDQVTRFSFAEDTREDIWFWKSWLHARAGKWTKFYMPSWSRDFTLVTDIQFNGNAIEVVDDQYRDFYALNTVKRDIAIYTTDGQVYYRRITAATEKAPAGSGVEILTINGELGTSYTVAQVKMISFLHPSRVDTDTIAFDWGSAGMAQLTFNTRTIPQ